MKQSACNSENQILQEAKRGSLSASAQEHLANCEDCSQVLRVDQLLLADAGRVPVLEHLPDPTLIWWRSRQLTRLRQSERATYPIRLVERLALVLGGLGLIIGLSLTWPTLGGRLDHWLSGWINGFSRTLPSQGSSLILTLTCSLFVLVGFGLYSQWSER